MFDFDYDIFNFLTLQTPDIKSLDQMLQIQPDKRDMILSNMKEALLPLIDKYVETYMYMYVVFPGTQNLHWPLITEKYFQKVTFLENL